MSRTDARPRLAPDATVACLDDEAAVAAPTRSRTSCAHNRVARELFKEDQFRITRTKQFKLLTRARAAPAGPRSVDARAARRRRFAVTADDFRAATSGPPRRRRPREHREALRAPSRSASTTRRTAPWRSTTSRPAERFDTSSRAQHVALDKELTFFATVLPETTSAAASFTLKMAFNSTAPRGFAPAGFAPCDPAAYAFDAAAVPNSIKLILGAVQGPRACELTYRGVQPLAIEEDSVAESAPPASGCFDLKLSDSLKDDDETQLDSARISPPRRSAAAPGGPPGGEAPDVVGDWRAKSPNGLLPIATGLGVPRSSPISQSSSIIRFLARHFKLDGGDDEASKVRADVLFETAKDLGAKASEVVEATGAGDAETASAKEAALFRELAKIEAKGGDLSRLSATLAAFKEHVANRKRIRACLDSPLCFPDTFGEIGQEGGYAYASGPKKRSEFAL
ncbi:hypothetical protein JL720_13536 [Aureococcus anophagefferens]|nr:hypothetical protein JL720_13536 [Aureococcus anophagefferens]